MWVTYAFLAAFFASLVSIFGKVGLKTVDPTLATAVRGVIMAVIVVGVTLALGKFKGFSAESFSSKEWLFIALAGVAGALSWIAFFFALAHGEAGPVNAVDKLSIVFIVVLAGLFLGETFSAARIAGAILITIGAVFIAVPFDKIKEFFSGFLS